jgi:hypothetical protein
VQMISTTRGLSAISGPEPGGATRDADGAPQEAPSAFRRAQNS